MVIRFNISKNCIRIFSDSKILPSDFKQWFLIQLISSFDLFERLNNQIKKLSISIIEESTELESSYIEKLKVWYANENIDGITFDELLETERLMFADLHLFEKDVDNCLLKESLGIIELHPDGDFDSIYIRVKSKDKRVMEFVVKSITEYNNTIK